MLVYVNSGITLADNIPPVFDKSKFTIKFENDGTWLYQDNELIFPITHDEKGNLYILNGTGQDFVKYSVFSIYKIDRANKEIVINHNLWNYTPRKKVCFQVIEVPKNRYSEIIENNKIRVRIKGGSAFQLMEYDFQTKVYTIINSYPYGK